MKILFISHNAHRAGAQLLLLNFLRWLKQNHKDIYFEVLMGGKGALLAEFEQVAVTYLVDIHTTQKGKLSKISNHLKNNKNIKKINNSKYDLYYSNTILNGELLGLLKTGATPVLCHVHEMEYWISKANVDHLNSLLKTSSNYIAASNAVVDYLVKSLKIDKEKISLIYEHIHCKNILTGDLSSIRKHLQLPKDTVLIGACGNESFRKGKDWFIPTAVQVLERTKNENIHFVWIGGKTSEELLFDLERCGFKNNIHFIKQLPDAHTYFNELSLFLMLSREDPFPTVNLEAGIWEVPVLCFENTGGTNELVEDGCGYAVPYANLTAMADKITYLIDNEQERKITGKRLKDKIIANYDIEIIGSEMVRLLKQKINK